MAGFDDLRAALDEVPLDQPLPRSARPAGGGGFDMSLLGDGERRQLQQLLALFAAQAAGQQRQDGPGAAGLGGVPNRQLGGGGLGTGPGLTNFNAGRFSNFPATPSDISRPFGPGLIFGGGRPFAPSQEFIDAFKTENTGAAIQNIIPILQSAVTAAGQKKPNTGAGTVTDPVTGRKIPG